MDLQSLYYFSELAKDPHMTRTAAKLFISQQTLSNHIQRLEEYYGVPLFYRKPSLTLTDAGEFVLAFANIVNKEQANLKDILADISKQERGFLRIGASNLRMNAVLPAILPEFSARYPRVELRIVEALSAQLLSMVVEGELDFAIMITPEPNAKLVSWDLMSEPNYLAVRDDLLRQYYGDETEAFKEKAIHGIELLDSALRLPFCLLDNRIGREIQGYLDEASTSPRVYANSSDVEVALSLCCNGLAASFLPQMRLARHQGVLPEDMNFFPLLHRGRPLTQNLSLVRHKERYLSHYTRYILELICQFFAETEQIDMSRKAPPYQGGKHGI